MARETRLSPRRAWKALSHLPLSPRRTQVRLKPLLFLRPGPPKGGKPKSEAPRFCTHNDRPCFDARLRSARLAAGVRVVPTARLQCKSAVCGLNGMLPSFAGFPPIKSSTRLGETSRLLRWSLFAPCQPENCRFRFGKKNCNANRFFSPDRNRRIPGENQREQSLARAEAATAS